MTSTQHTPSLRCKAHYQSPVSQRYNQSFVKEFAKPAQGKNFKIFLPCLKEKKKNFAPLIT